MQPDETESASPISEAVGTRLLFENDRIRVWDLALAPGESLATHVHRLPYCFIVAQGGHLKHADPANPDGGHEVNYGDDLVVFLDPTAQEGDMVHTTLTNIGDRPYKNYVIELKDGQG